MATHANVIEALAAVMADLPAIGKDMKSADSGPQSYKYRGIEQITAAAQPLFARHGVVIVPTVLAWAEPREFQVKSGATWTDERVMVTYRVYGPGGVNDFVEAQLPGIGRDNSDKGTNKALTQAYKYLLLQMLMVADPKDDNDEHKQERDGPPAPSPGIDRVRFRAAVTRAGLTEQAVCEWASQGERSSLDEFDDQDAPALRAAFKTLAEENKRNQIAGDGTGEDRPRDATSHEGEPAPSPPEGADLPTTANGRS